MDNVIFENTPKIPMDAFLDTLSYEFTDAPYGVLENCLKRTVCRMCERTNVLRRVLYIHTQENVHNYLLEPPDCMDVIALMSVGYCQTKFLCSELIRMNRRDLRHGCCCHGNTVCVEGNEIIFSNPKNGDVYRVEISVKPGRDSCELDSILLDEYEETVLMGVKAMMFEMSDKPWSSIQRAQLCEQSFLRECAEVAVDVLNGGQRGAYKAKRQRAF